MAIITGRGPFNVKTEGAYLHGCGNWYTRVLNDEMDGPLADICNQPHSPTACCHYNEKPSGPSEVVAAQAYQAAQAALDSAKGGRMDTPARVLEAVAALEKVKPFLEVRQAYDRETGQTHSFTTAEAFALPGTGIVYDLEGLKLAIRKGRRPESDLMIQERIVRVTRGMAELAMTTLQEARAILAVIPPSAPVAAPLPPQRVRKPMSEEAKQRARDNLAKARANKTREPVAA